MRYRVAITGLGIISCLGNSISSVGSALYTGQSGIETDAKRIELGFISPLTGKIRNFSPIQPLSRKQRKTMPEFVEWTADAAFQAIKHANIELEELQNERSGLIFGCDSSCIAAITQVDKMLAGKSSTCLGSGLVFQSMTSCISMNLNTLFQTKGACWTVSAACASGGHAVGQAADLIMLGRQDRVLCGAAQEINWQSMCSFDGLGAFSENTAQAAEASRPFDAARDGLVPSGGAAAIMLERYDLAQKRGARILGELVGYGFSSDGENIAVPSRTGLGRAMRSALTSASLQAADISYICAHATSTPVGDSMEAMNITDLFGEKAVPVSSTKSMTGHELWMSGASQVVYTSIMAEQGFMAPNINFSQADLASAKLDIIWTTRSEAPRIALCNSAGFGGTNACLILAFQGKK